MTTAMDQLLDRQLDKIHSRQYEADFRRWLRNPNDASGLIPAHFEGRAMGVNTGTAGGFFAPEGFSREVWKRLTASSVMRTVSTVSEVLGIDAGFPYVDDSSNKGRILVENTEATTETDLAVALKKIPAFMFDSDLLRVSRQFLMDADIEQVEEFLIGALSERIARNLNQYCTTGSGADQPHGLATAATVGVTGGTGQSTSVTWDDLESLIASVPAAYVYGQNGISNTARWMMNENTFRDIRKLKDGSGNPIWRGDPEGRSPGTLAGFRVAINPDMPNMAANAKPIVFGKLSSYCIRDGVLVVQNLIERYAEYGQVGFRVCSRHGGGLVDPAGVRAFQNSAS